MKLMKDNMAVITSAFLLLLSTFGIAQEEPAAAEKDPATQSVHAAEPIAAKVPGGHTSLQSACPTSGC